MTQTVKVFWLIPVVPNISLLGLVKPFEKSLWYAIGIVFSLTVIIKKLFLTEISFLDVFALIIGTCIPREPERASSRIQYLSWSIFGYILSQSYLASLAGVLVKEASYQIETMEELISAGFEYGGLHADRERFSQDYFLQDSDTDDSKTHVIQRIYDNFVVLRQEEYRENLQELINGKNEDMALVATMNTSIPDIGLDSAKVQRLVEPLGTYLLAIATRPGLPYLTRIDRKIGRLIETGLMNFWENRYAGFQYGSSGDNGLSDVLGLPQLVPGFLLLTIGLLAGIIIFLLELLLEYSKKRKLKARGIFKRIGLSWLRKNKKTSRTERIVTKPGRSDWILL